MLKRLTISALAAVMLGGCASLGNQFEMAKADQLQPGISTEDDAIALLGKPIQSKVSDDGKTEKVLWAYAFASDFGTEAKRLVILFDKDGKMIRILERGNVS